MGEGRRMDPHTLQKDSWVGITPLPASPEGEK